MARTAQTTRTVAVVVSATLALGAGALAGVPPASAATVDTTASYVFVNRHSGKAMDLYDWSTAENAPVNQWTRNDLAVQQWQFVDAGGGFYKVRSRHSGKVLELPSGSDGTQLVQSTDRSSATQQFRLQDSAGGFVRFVNRQWNKVIDVWGWSTADGGRLAGYSDLDGGNQQWQLIRLGGGTPTTSAPTTPAPAYPQPGRVTGDIGVHDPTVVRRPDGTYLVAHTGDDIALKTSTDRVAFRNAGTVSPVARRGPPRTRVARATSGRPTCRTATGAITCTTRRRPSAPTVRRSSWPPAPPEPPGAGPTRGWSSSRGPPTTSTPSTRTSPSTTRAAGGSPSARSGPASR